MATAPNAPYLKEKKGKKDAKSDAERRSYWSRQISKAKKRWDTFWCDGDRVVDRFMLESQAGGKRTADTYNILYSSTETIKPSLYAQTPKAEARARATDTQDAIKVNAALLIEQIGQYAIERVDFDGVMKNVVADYVLPGMGTAWVRYEPKFAQAYDNDNRPLVREDGSPQEYLTAEGLGLDYVHYRDVLYGVCRFWKECPWVARRVFFTKKQATKRFGATKAGQLSYTFNCEDRSSSAGSVSSDNSEQQAIIYEIWDKVSGCAIWYSDDYPDDLLDIKPDPLKLENFFPTPEPVRAVWSTRTLVPRALYSQYKTQAAELDRLTERIRYLTEALKVRGIYDASQAVLKNLLDGPGNRMIPVENWAAILQNKGLDGSVMWVPIKDVVLCLTELLKQREICKNEIYEITGFSDIVRGVSKASETLGAQQLKSDWATGRLKDMQREVQRFCRDIIRLMVEIACEHFNDETLLLYSGVTPPPPPSPEEQQAAMMAAMQGQPVPPNEFQQFQEMTQQVFALVRKEKLRCAQLEVETDSTILPDEEKERKDRMDFLGAIGAFLQQAGPMALQYPDMRGLLGGIMMFTIRTFPASRPLEKQFEEFVQKLQQQPPMPPPGQEGGKDGEAAAQASLQTAQIKADTDKATTTETNQLKKYEIDERIKLEKDKAQMDHDYRMAQLDIERQKLELERQKAGAALIKEDEDTEFERSERAFEREDKERDRLQQQASDDTELEKALIEREDAREDADREAELANRQQDLAEMQADTQADQSQQQIDNAAKESKNKPKKD